MVLPEVKTLSIGSLEGSEVELMLQRILIS